MKSKIILLIFFFIGVKSIAQVSGVGINKDNPQQALHLGSQTGTIRVDGLNSTNNTFNGGGVDQTYPVYVDHNGDLTLKVSAFQNSDGSDAYTTAAINGTVAITAIQLPNDGYETVEMTSYTFTVARNTTLEIKYSLSIEVFQDNLLTIIKDPYARNITNFFTLDTPVLAPTTRRYAPSSRCYFNRNDAGTNPAALPDAATGYIYNSGTTYMNLTPGTHTLRFYGTVCSGSANRPTFVRFAGGPDSIFIRLY
ncbi:hypothetical protein [Flavobacterium sp.]|uniref:hypothetical protein n=1 Tax=Flavobacterium sp. TaxID=239 RepID=UPI0008B6B9E2|nr:hypothetical protein [Flavobacterium sp.]OGS60797.1 MAG: hypothetical protein A2X07_01680 [Flavobacteria bacterium GWF1_32_7]HBD26327.1 hypothetical protein [Flavobacterium sp.]